MSDAAAGLSADNFDPLNREFYSAKPHEQFVRKLNLLLLYAGRADEVDGLLKDGVAYDRLTLTHDPDKEPAADEIEKSRLEYVTIETEILYHHAIETLLRLYLAHEGHPECPWLEISRLQSKTLQGSASTTLSLRRIRHNREVRVSPSDSGGSSTGEISWWPGTTLPGA